jgi:glycosyltransferase involved in cell wall biosynthesis
VIDTHVVLLTNYIRKHHVAAFQEIQKRVHKLTILLSVPMEPDRNWEAEWGELDVIVQKNRMITTNWKHSSGFSENNFIHIPTDTTHQLKRLQPDIILSYEMGMRTLLCATYRLLHRNCRLVMVGNMSQHIEAERGLLRKTLRSVIKRGCDYFTFNGPSCRRYLKSLNIEDSRLSHFPYCIDQDTVYRGPRPTANPQIRKMIYCGAMSQRKGILQFAEVASRWSAQNPDQKIELSIAGTGELKQQISDLSVPGFQIEFLGDCNTNALQSAYRNADICVFPTLADEWGLVPIEAMASGLPVLGSFYAQSIETHVVEGESGWIFRPDNPEDIESALARAMQTDPQSLTGMSQSAKDAASKISPESSAENICNLIRSIQSELQTRN